MFDVEPLPYEERRVAVARDTPTRIAAARVGTPAPVSSR